MKQIIIPKILQTWNLSLFVYCCRIQNISFLQSQNFTSKIEQKYLFWIVVDFYWLLKRGLNLIDLLNGLSFHLSRRELQLNAPKDKYVAIFNEILFKENIDIVLIALWYIEQRKFWLNTFWNIVLVFISSSHIFITYKYL